jgi:tetratricopeptide (TPR) repeat protein
MRRSQLLTALSFAALISSSVSTAQGVSGSSTNSASNSSARARMPVRVIGGRLVVRCEVSTKYRRIPSNLFLDFDHSCGLELHNKAAAGLKVDTGKGVPITIHLAGFNISVERREHGDEDDLDNFTKLYSKELGETACVGTIGSAILQNYHLVFDIRSGFVILAPPRPNTGAIPEEEPGTTVISMTVTNNQVWIPVRISDRRVLSMNLATSHYDTLVDQDICEALDKPGGDIGPVLLKTTDLHKYVALRPTEIVQVHADGVLGTVGINLLENFRVEIDHVNKFVKFEETKTAQYPAADLDYFNAMVADDPDALNTVLTKHPGERLAREASEMLLNLLVDSGEPLEKFIGAITWMNQTRIADLRSTEALTTMKMLLEARRPKVAILAGELGVKSGRQDRYPESVHKLHAKLGELMLKEKDHDKAWEHLLSAAFGLPQDGMINLHLGQFYESQKRYKRAMSRYVQAVIAPESGALAIKGLERVQQATGAEALSVDLVDKLISGKVYNFGAATTFKPDDATSTNRVALMELFTNPHLGQRLPEGWRSFNVGGVMGQEGILSHFPRERVAVLTYHVADPEPSALINSLSMATAELYRDTRPVYTKINGRITGPGYGRARDAEKIYAANRKAITQQLALGAAFTLSASAKVENGNVKGAVTVKGPAVTGLHLQVILAERGVLYPGKGNVVVHRMVARTALTGDVDGIPLRIKDGSMTFRFNKSLAAIKTSNEEFLAEYEKKHAKNATRLSTQIDPRQITIVAFVRDALSLEVLQAVQINAKGPTIQNPK